MGFGTGLGLLFAAGCHSNWLVFRHTGLHVTPGADKRRNSIPDHGCEIWHATYHNAHVDLKG